MRVNFQLKNIIEIMNSLNEEINSLLQESFKENLQNLQNYQMMHQHLVNKLNQARKAEVLGRRYDKINETERQEFEQLSGNLIYELIAKMGKDLFLKNRQKIFFCFWFLGQFDIYALELSQ